MPSKISVKIIVFFLLGALIAPVPGLAEYTLQPGEDICGDGIDTNGDGLDPTPYQCSCPESVNAGNSSTLVKYLREDILLKTENGKKYFPWGAYGVCPLTEKLDKEINEAMAKTPKTKTTYNTYYYHTDHLGGTSVVTDEQGEVIEVLDYYPYGDTRISEQTRDYGTTKKFTGQEEDPESDLYYYGSRYYDPSIGRFTQQDPLFQAIGDEGGVKEITGKSQQELLADPQKLNSYSYGRNNPVNYVDETGEMPNINQAGKPGDLLSVIKNIEQNNPEGSFRQILSEVAEHYRFTPDTETNKRYFYTESKGWIDAKHFFFAADKAYSYTFLPTYLAGLKVEIEQWLNESSSAFSYEDLPSNFLGSRFGDTIRKYRLLSIFKEVKLSDLAENFFGKQEVREPQEAPNYNSLPNLDDILEDKIIPLKNYRSNEKQ